MIYFVGAGSGAPDLITVRGAKLLGEADVIVYAGSLVNPALLEYKKEGCEVYDSAKMTLEEVIAVMAPAAQAGKTVVRLHTGDPCVYGAHREQMDALDRLGLAYEICPGVSSFCGAAAALKAEYTLPNVSQTVILTRMEGRTPVPEKEQIEALAAHGATMVIFLSAGMLEELSVDCFDPGCVSRYRILLSDLHPAPAWQRSIAEHFLPCVGAVAKGSDGQYHPTAAGLLMFGKEPAIRREFPDYLLDYQELDDTGSLVCQLSSRSGDWSGSLFDFYFLVFRRLLSGTGRKGPEAIAPSGSDAVRAALSEALGNCLIHADYRAKSGLSIRKEPESIVIANPGSFRVAISEATAGGRSDLRNATLARMFSLIHIGRGEGRGIPGIRRAWKEQGWEAPVLTEQLSPARITLTLRLKRGERERAGSSVQKARRQAILEYLTAVPEADAAQIARAVGLSASHTGGYLRALLKEDILIRKRAGRKFVYRLKA